MGYKFIHLKRVLFFIVFTHLFNCYWLGAQQSYNYINLNVDKGLAASECYTVVQDRKGYIWIGTEAGISRYDGYGFTTFINPDKRVDNTILRLHIDYKNRLWYSTYNGYFGYIRNNRMYNHPLGNDLVEKLDISFVHNSFIDSNDNIWLFSNNTMICIDTLNNIDSTYNISNQRKAWLMREIIKANYIRVYHHNFNMAFTTDTPYTVDHKLINHYKTAFF